MKLEELDDLSRDKLFEGIKDVCRTQAKKELFVEVLFIVFSIVVTISCLDPEKGIGNTILICSFVGLIIALSWLTVNSLSLFLGVKNCDTPEHLSHWLKKRNNRDRKVYYLCFLLAIIVIAVNPYAINRRDWFVIGLDLTMAVIFIGLCIYSFFNEDILDNFMLFKSSFNDEVNERLQNLIDNK